MRMLADMRLNGLIQFMPIFFVALCLFTVSNAVAQQQPKTREQAINWSEADKSLSYWVLESGNAKGWPLDDQLKMAQDFMRRIDLNDNGYCKDDLNRNRKKELFGYYSNYFSQALSPDIDFNLRVDKSEVEYFFTGHLLRDKSFSTDAEDAKSRRDAWIEKTTLNFFKKYDINHDGVIDMVDFLNFKKSRRVLDLVEQIGHMRQVRKNMDSYRLMFRWDVNGDGCVVLAELLSKIRTHHKYINNSHN